MQAALLIHEHVAAGLVGHVAYDSDAGITLDLLVIRLRYGEEQLVVLAAVERTGRGIQVEITRRLVG